MKSAAGTSTDGTAGTSSIVPILCLLGVVALLSSITLTIKYIFQHSGVQPVELAQSRVIVGFAFLLAVTLWWDRRGLLSLGRSDLLVLIGVGLLGVLSYAVAAYGLMHTSVTHYALIYSLLPACTALLSVLAGKDHLTPAKLAGMSLSLVGCLAAISDHAASVEASIGIGDALVLVFTIMMLAHIALSAGIVRRFGVMVSNTIMFGGSAAVLFLASLQWTESPRADLSSVIIAAVTYVGFGTAAVFLLRYRALQTLSPATVGIYHNLIPIATILLACLCLDESLGLQTIIGGLAVVAGAELVRRAQMPVSSAPSPRAWAKPLLPAVVGNKFLR